MSQTTEPRWDLAPLYAGPTDPRIASDLAAIHEAIRTYKARHHGRVAGLSPAELRLAIEAKEQLMGQLDRLAGFTWMCFYTDTRDEEARSAYTRVWADYARLNNEFEFLKQELRRLPEPAFKALQASPELQPYRYVLDRWRAWTPHTLSEAEERILVRKKTSGEQAWTQLFTELTSEIRYLVPDGHTDRMVTLSEARGLRVSPQRHQRKSAALGALQALSEQAHVFSATFNAVFADHLDTCALRGIGDPMRLVLLEHDMEREVVSALMDTTEAHYGLAQRYYRLKAEVLGLKDFALFDTQAPLDAGGRELSFVTARDLVCANLEAFSPRFGRQARAFFDERRIDPYPAAGKPPGAFAFGMGPATPPYIFLNYQGGLTDVVAMAHELGHGIHYTMAAERQSHLNAYTSPPMLETVSIFSESLMFDRLVAQEEDPRVRAQLLATQIEGAISSIMRQVMYTRWELAAYADREAGPLSPTRFGDLWMAENRRLYGDAVIVPELERWGWLLNPFFITQRFVNYSYAFGQLLVYGLLERHRAEGQAFVAKYQEFLGLGGSASPVELLAVLGVDVRDPGFWADGFRTLTRLIDRFEAEVQSIQAAQQA